MLRVKRIRDLDGINGIYGMGGMHVEDQLCVPLFHLFHPVDPVLSTDRIVRRSVFCHGLEPFEVGRDSITPIDPAYKDKGLYEFMGKIDRVKFELK